MSTVSAGDLPREPHARRRCLLLVGRRNEATYWAALTSLLVAVPLLQLKEFLSFGQFVPLLAGVPVVLFLGAYVVRSYEWRALRLSLSISRCSERILRVTARALAIIGALVISGALVILLWSAIKEGGLDLTPLRWLGFVVFVSGLALRYVSATLTDVLVSFRVLRTCL